MPNTMELGIDAAKLMLIIGGRPYPLVSEPMTIHIPGSVPGSPPNLRFHLKYERDYDESIDLGTAETILGSIEEAFSSEGISVPSGTDSLVNQWNRLVTSLGSVPFFDTAVSTISDIAFKTRIQITEIEAKITTIKDKEGYYQSEFRFGLMFTPSTRPHLFNIEVQAFGATLTLKFTVEKSKLAKLIKP